MPVPLLLIPPTLPVIRKIQIDQISALATSVFEGEDKAAKWLSTANPATDNRAPIELVAEPEGFERVKNVLLRESSMEF